MSSFSCVPHEKFAPCKGDVTRDYKQPRFFAQRGIALLEQCCNHLNQSRNHVATLCCDKIIPYNVTLRGLDFGIWKLLLVESEILFGIRNTVQGIRNPTNDWNPESQFHWRRIRDPWSAWNPEFRTVLDFFIGEKLFHTRPSHFFWILLLWFSKQCFIAFCQLTWEWNKHWSHKFIYFLKLNGDSIVENGKKTFWYFSLPLLLHDYDVKLSSYMLVRRKCRQPH